MKVFALPDAPKDGIGVWLVRLEIAHATMWCVIVRGRTRITERQTFDQEDAAHGWAMQEADARHLPYRGGPEPEAG